VAVIRFADDTIVGFQYQTHADRFLENLRERLGKFGLELHPEKTRRIEFDRFAEENRKRRREGKPETFDFLGFQHMSGKNRLGRFTVRRRMIRKRMRAKLRELKQQLRIHMHDPVPQTGGWLKSVVQGYINYYAVPGNLESLAVSCSGADCWGCGGELFVAGASNATYRGPGCWRWADDGYLNRACSIRYPAVRFAASHLR
jgi:RNA-directed DNA polymerase